MINFIFEIVNPFSNKFSGLFIKRGRLTQVKSWELNAYRTNTIFLIGLNFTIKRDHAGGKVRLGAMGFEVEFQIYDARHWDPQLNRWE